ncbi:MAG: ATP-binding protein [Polaromonas sp.]
MKLQRTLSIRANLAVLVAVCLLPAMVAAAGILTYHYQRQRAQLVGEAVASARALKNSVNTELAAVQTILEVLATSPYLQNQDLAAFHAQATKVLSGSFINNIAVIAPDGQQMVNTAQPWGRPLPKTGVAAQVERVIATGQAEVSGLTIGALLKRPLISVAVPVRSGQTVTYVMTGVLLPSRLQKIISNSSQPADRIIAIFDKSSIIAARSHDQERFVGKSVAPGLAARLKEVNEDALDLVTLEGIPVLSVFSRSGATGWGAAIGIPMQALTAELRRSMWLLATATTLLLSLALGLAWMMGGRISRAIVQLVQPALDLAHGKAVNVPELTVKEADELGRSLMLTSVVLESTTNALKSSETRMRSILQSAMDAIITVDDQQKVVLFNSAASAMFACPEEQALGQPVTVFIPERFHAQHFAYVEKNRAPSDGSEVFGVAGVAIGLRSGGEEFPLEVSYSNVVAPDGIFHTLIIRDITTRVQSFQALERSNLDLQQFAYVASHDLKTPLRSISGFVQILERNHADKLDENGLALIRRTAQAASRLEQLTEDMLSFARVNSDPRPFAPVASQEVVVEAVHLLDALVQSTGASVTVGDLPIVMGDRTQLVQLFLNLLGNSLKYCQGRAPVVHVSAIREGNEWVFSVADNGIGIEPKHHQKIFEIFKRLHTQNEYAGTGIGLAVCHRIVDRHHGRIWVESSLGEGSTFRFTFPINSGATP